MNLTSIQLNHFRNYKELSLELDKGINIFYGDKAQGKTNILEAIYVCGMGKSHRGSKDKELIAFDSTEAHIKAYIEKKYATDRVDIHLKTNKSKGIAVNGIPIRRTSELFGLMNVVVFSPEDLQLIKNGPSERRKFIDLELCQLDKLYVHHLIHYNKVLAQRNQLLKDLTKKNDYEDILDIYDLQLIQYGCKIVQLRKNFLEQLNEIVQRKHSIISGGKERLQVIYEPNVEEDLFAAQLQKSRERDKKQKITLVGPHRDDIMLTINSIDIRKYGSQGQQRTAALSLKMAEIELVTNVIKDSPILLLDDVLSELDFNRQNQLLNCIDGIQTIITCTGVDDFIHHRFHMDKIFHVEQGTVSKQN